MGEPYPSTRGRMEFASAGEVKLSDTFVLLEKKKKKRNSSKEEKKRNYPPKTK